MLPSLTLVKESPTALQHVRQAATRSRTCDLRLWSYFLRFVGRGYLRCARCISLLFRVFSALVCPMILAGPRMSVQKEPRETGAVSSFRSPRRVTTRSSCETTRAFDKDGLPARGGSSICALQNVAESNSVSTASKLQLEEPRCAAAFSPQLP